MFKRVMSSVIGIAFLILILVINDKFSLIINLVLSVIAAICAYELCDAYGTAKNKEFMLPTLVFVASLPIIGYAMGWASMVFVYVFIVLIVMIFDYKKIEIKTLITNASLVVFVGAAISTLVLLRSYGKGYCGIFYLLIPLVLSWSSDSGAFFVGKYFGKNKLCPEISPKKTIEGVLGGILSGVIGVFILSIIADCFFLKSNMHLNYIAIFFMAVLAVPVGVLGDLLFSIVKRSCGIKDFGNIMPGHGGLLDRFDSVILVAPFIYIFIRYIPIVL